MTEPSPAAPAAVPVIAPLLRTGGIWRCVEPLADSATALDWLVRAAAWPAEIDQPGLLQGLLAREQQASTAIGDGVAIPHPANPAALGVREPRLLLGLLTHPVAFGAPDDQPVHALFLPLSPTTAWHLRLLGRLGRVLQVRAVIEALSQRPDDAQILERLLQAECELCGCSPAGR